MSPHEAPKESPYQEAFGRSLAEQAKPLIIRRLQYQEMMSNGVPVAPRLVHNADRDLAMTRSTVESFGPVAVRVFNEIIDDKTAYVPKGLLPYDTEVSP